MQMPATTNSNIYSAQASMWNLLSWNRWKMGSGICLAEHAKDTWSYVKSRESGNLLKVVHCHKRSRHNSKGTCRSIYHTSQAQSIYITKASVMVPLLRGFFKSKSLNRLWVGIEEVEWRSTQPWTSWTAGRSLQWAMHTYQAWEGCYALLLNLLLS